MKWGKMRRDCVLVLALVCAAGLLSLSRFPCLSATLKEALVAFQTFVASVLKKRFSCTTEAAPSAKEIAVLCSITATIAKTCTSCTAGCGVRCGTSQISTCDAANKTITELFGHHFPLLYTDAHWGFFVLQVFAQR